MARGGKRSGAGRPKVTAEVQPETGKAFFTSVLDRIGKEGWDTIKSTDGMKNSEDYALAILAQNDAEAHSFFKFCLDHKHGKAAQSVITADTRETTPELEFGNLTMPQSQPGTAGKPN